MAISPYVVSFVHRHFGYCDLLGRSVIHNVAGEPSSVSLATGTARKVACCACVPGMMEAPGPSPARASLFMPFGLGGLIGAALFAA